MSKGKIKKPNKVVVFNDLYEKKLEDAILTVVQSCEVEVENTEWENANQNLRNEIDSIDGYLESYVALTKELMVEVGHLKANKPMPLAISINQSPPKNIGVQHVQFSTLLKILSTGLHVYLVGPAGSGKTYAASQCAKALGIPFYFTGAVASEFKLTGFIDAQGRIVSTEFRKAYENGGLFLFDEIDASYPQAVLAFNAALANDYMDFPDKRVQRHQKFYCIAAANTYGQGADRQYVGRNQLDAASIDRFAFLDWLYDENLEQTLAGNKEWTNFVQKVRKFIEKNKIRHVVSPRASIAGAKLLANGISRKVVETIILWKGLDEATQNKIIEGIKPSQTVIASRNGQFQPLVNLNQTVKAGNVIANFRYLDKMYGWRNEPQILAPIDGRITFIAENTWNVYGQNQEKTLLGQDLFVITRDNE